MEAAPAIVRLSPSLSFSVLVDSLLGFSHRSPYPPWNQVQGGFDLPATGQSVPLSMLCSRPQTSEIAE